MIQENWAKNDYQTGLGFVTDHEDEAIANIVLPAEKNTTVIIPMGLPLYGAGFYGIFMLAPIVLFIIIITYFIFFILTTNSFEIQTQILFSSGSLALLWGLIKALKLLISSRDLFPRKYFTTLGEKGIATHYSKLHFPFHSKGAITWNDLDSTGCKSTLFLPGLFAGIIRTTIIEIKSKNGGILKIPFHVPPDKNYSVSEEILNLITDKWQNGNTF